MTCRPGHAPRHPDFTSGNTAAAKHHAQSPRALAALAEQIAPRLVESAPWLGLPTFADELRALCWAEAELELRRTWISDQGLLDADGVDRPGIERYHRAAAHAARLRADNGLSLAGHLKLLTMLKEVDPDAVQDALNELRKVGRQVRQAAEARALNVAEEALPKPDDQETTP